MAFDIPIQEKVDSSTDHNFGEVLKNTFGPDKQESKKIPEAETAPKCEQPLLPSLDIEDQKQPKDEGKKEKEPQLQKLPNWDRKESKKELIMKSK